MELARRLGGTELYNCASCAARPALLEALGHNGPPTQYWRENLLSGQPLARCPVRDLLDAATETPDLAAEVERYIATYAPAYRDGYLLQSGGIVDQPARYLEMIQHIMVLDSAAEAKRAELSREQE